MRVIVISAAVALIATLGCKRKSEVNALDKNDGRGKTKDCPLVAGGLIAKDTTVQAGCLVTVGEPYTIKNGATLTIEPGARLAFKKDARIVVEDGAIVAQGNKQEPIVFTSNEKTPAAGDWGGLVFASSKPSTLVSVVIEYAGAEPKLPPATPQDAKAAALAEADTFGLIGAIERSLPLADRKPALYLGRAAKLVLADAIVRNSVRVGLAADGDEPFDRFEGNRFENNGGFALDVPANALGKVVTIEGSEPVRVRGKVRATQTWPKVEAGIVVGSLRVIGEKSNVVLTLAPETVLRVEPQVSLRFGNFRDGGAIVANKVTFTSAAAKPAPGDWGSIQFGKYAPGTSLDGCIVEYAGFDDPPPPPKKAPGSKTKEPQRPKMAALLIEEPMKDFKIVRTTFRNNAGPGMGKTSSYSPFFSLLGAGTGGCEGLDNPKNENKSIGQPLCEYHEDPMKDFEMGILGALGKEPKGNVFGPGAGQIGDLDSAGLGWGGGSVGGVIGGPGTGLGSIGKGSGTGYGAPGGAIKTK